MFFKDYYINYFNIKYNQHNVTEFENRSNYTLTLYNVTQFLSNDGLYNAFLTNYIVSMDCNIEFKAIFKDNGEVEDIDLRDIDFLKDINDIGLKYLTLVITKPTNKFIIFDTHSFFDNLKEIMIKDILNYFTKHNNLFVFDLDEEIKNEYYSIYKINNSKPFIDKSIDISKKINIRNELSFFYNASEYNFIPDMFCFEEIRNKHINDIFKYLLFITSIIFISDYSFFKENEFTFKIKDKKFSISSYEELSDMFNLHPDLADNYYLIYDWIYNDTVYDNTSDKFEIALHTIDKCNTSNEIYIEKRIFEIIKNSFTLYLKENVDKYLLFKQKIVDSITNSISGCYQILSDVKKTHTQFLLSILTVLFTLLISETITENKIKLLSDEVAIILYVLILIIFILSYFRKEEAIKNINNIFKVSLELKEKIYKDLRIEDDTLELFNQNDVIKELSDYQNLFYLIIVIILASIFIINKFF